LRWRLQLSGQLRTHRLLSPDTDPVRNYFDEEKRPVRLTANEAPHRPGISSALGLRAAGDDFF